MKKRIAQLALLFALLNVTSSASVAVDEGIIHPMPPIKSLGPEEEVTLDVSCVNLFEHDTPSVAGVLILAKMSEEKNWREFTESPECAAALSAKSEVLSVGHIREILTPIWPWAKDSKTAATPTLRMMTLYTMGCLSNIKAWDAVNEDDSLEPFNGINLKSLNHWATFKPEVLSKLIDIQKVYSDLPRPTDTSRRALRRILDSSLFRSAKNLNWTIFDSNVLSYLASKSSDLALKYSECLLDVVSGLNDEVLLAVAALRTEGFLKMLLTDSDPYDSEMMGLIVTNLVNCRRSISTTTSLPLVKAILSDWSPEMREIVIQQSAQMGPQLVTAIGEFVIGQDSDTEMVVPSFTKFHQLMTNAPHLPPKLDIIGWCAEYLFLHPATTQELADHQHLLQRVFDKAFEEFSIFLGGHRDEYHMNINPPTMAMKLCSIMMKAQVKGANESFLMIQDAFQEKANLRRSVLNAMKGKPDVGPVCYALAKTVQDLKAVAVVVHRTKNLPSLEIKKHTPDGGFDINETVALIETESDVIAHSALMLKVPNMIDYGGPMRGWLYESFNAIKESLTTRHHSKSMYLKYSWPVGKHAGMICGMLLGKAIQSSLQSTFAIDPDFYALLLDLDDKKIDKYYMDTYQQDKNSYMQHNLLQKFSPEEFEAYKNSDMELPAPETLTFKSINQESNLFQVPEQSKLVDLKQYNQATIVSELFPLYDKQAMLGFREFVKTFAEYLNKTFRVADLRHLRERSLLATTFNSQSLEAEKLIRAIHFTDVPDPKIDSLFSGHQIGLHDCIRSYIRALTPVQLAKFLAVWTGASTISLDPNSLDIHVHTNPTNPPTLPIFSWDYVAEPTRKSGGHAEDIPSSHSMMQMDHEPMTGIASLENWGRTPSPQSIITPNQEIEMQEGSLAMETVDEDMVEDRNADLVVIKEGEEFRELVTKIARLQHEALKLDQSVKFDPQTLTHGMIYSSTATTCSTLITITVQTSYNLIRSLATLTNVPVGDFVDAVQPPRQNRLHQSVLSSSSAED